MKLPLIQNIFIFLTPMHYKAAEVIFKESLTKETSLVLFYSKMEMPENTQAKVLPLPNLEFQKTEFINYFGVKRKIKTIEKFLDSVFAQFVIDPEIKLILGTDQAMFNQLMMSRIHNNFSKSKIILVDEGFGFYTLATFKDKLLRKIYPLVSRFIFGLPIFHIEPMGTHPYVKEIYIRKPEFLKVRMKNKIYSKFYFSVEKKSIKEIPDGQMNQKILLFSFPNKDLGIGNDKKAELYKYLFSKISSLGFEINVKPHPREDVEYLKEIIHSGDFSVTILDQREIGEYLNYNNYSKIINFKSSIIFDLLEQNYPHEKIITMGFTKRKQEDLIFGENYFNVKKFDFTRFAEILQKTISRTNSL